MEGRRFQSAEERKEAVRAFLRKEEEHVREIFDSGEYLEYLKVMSRFHRYSVRNTILIHLQNPEASRVAGYTAWQTQFGRNVKKGASAIRIFAPIRYRIKSAEEKTEAEELVPKDEDIYRLGFKVVNVFDVKDTEGKALPEFVKEISGSVDQYEQFLSALRDTSLVPICFEDLDPSTDGYYSPREKRIVIRSRMSEVQTAAAIIHEMAHSVLHDSDLNGMGSEQKDRRTMEVEAESVAYVCCQYYGIETGANSLGYVASWSSGKELKELHESLEIIRKTADRFIDSVEQKLGHCCQIEEKINDGNGMISRIQKREELRAVQGIINRDDTEAMMM